MIGPVELQQVAVLFGLRREQHRLDRLGPGQERTGVPPPRQVLLPRIGQTRRGVLAHRLIEAEPGPLPARVRLQQRSGNQLTNQRADLTALDRLCPRHLPGRGQVEPPGEYAQPTEHNRGVSRQQRMTPGQACIQGVMASPACAPGRPSRRSQPLREFGKRGNPQPDGHQFDRQGQPARLTADAARQRQLSRSRLKRHPRHRGPGQEQRHRLRHHRRVDLAGNGHRRHPPHAFGLDVKRDTARHQKPQSPRPAPPAGRKHDVPIPARARSYRSPATTGSPTSHRQQHQVPPPPGPPGSPPPQPGRQPPGPRYDTAPSRRSTPAPPGPPIPRSRPPQPPQRSSPPRRRRPASPPHNVPAWPRSPRAPQLSRQTKTASAATAPPAGPSRHHHHGRRARRRSPPPADPIAVTGGQPGHPETPPAAGSARTSPADHQEEDQRPRIPAPNGRNADLYGAERPSQRAR